MTDRSTPRRETLTDSPSPRGRTAVTWLVTLIAIGVMAYMSVNRAMVEDEKPVHHSHEAPAPSGH